MALVTIEDIRSYLTVSGTAQDANLMFYANLASAVVESYCGRSFQSQQRTEYLDGGRASVFVKNIPINNVTAVWEYDGTQYVKLQPPTLAADSLPNVAANSVAIEYTWDSDTGQITRSFGASPTIDELDYFSSITFTNFKRGVKVEYNGGYDTIPLDIKMTVLDYTKMLHKQDQGMQVINFQGETKQATSLSANFPAHIRRVLDLYRIL